MMRRILRSSIDHRDRGAALITVIGVGALIAALVTTAIVFTAAGARQARDDSDWNAALAAAYAGVEEYQSRLAAMPEYVLYGDPDAPFSRTSSITLPEVENPAFGVDGAWAAVPGSGDEARFRYEVDTSRFRTESVLRLRSTGQVGDETRTIVADLRQSAFVHYLYFTDLEIQDPEVTVGASGSKTVPPACYLYEWSIPTPRPASGCGPMIRFDSKDVIDGQVHTNDVIHSCGATFMQRVTTAWNPSSGVRYEEECGRGSTRFHKPDGARGGPMYQPQLTMPETNSQIRAAALDFGCVYTGPTSIELLATGRMIVRSPSTRDTYPGASGHNCGTPGTARGELGHADGASVDLPDGGAVYVQNVPVTGDPNAAATPRTCTGSGNGIGYPVANEQPPAAIAGIAPYDCRKGDLFVKGVMNGEATLAAENFVYIVGDVKYLNQDDDLLGLIGNNMVYVHNPALKYNCNKNGKNCDLYTSTKPRTVHAAILSLRSFAVQNTSINGNSRQALNVRGSIAQAFRGVVAQNSGYDKDYDYDPRLQFRSPPHFLSPVTSAYGVSTWIETESAIDPDGTWR